MVSLFIDENHLKGKLTIVRCAKFSNESICLISADYYRLLPPPHRPVFANYCTYSVQYAQYHEVAGLPAWAAPPGPGCSARTWGSAGSPWPPPLHPASQYPTSFRAHRSNRPIRRHCSVFRIYDFPNVCANTHLKIYIWHPICWRLRTRPAGLSVVQFWFWLIAYL